METAWHIFNAIALLCVAFAFLGWVVRLARHETTLRATFYDEHGPRPAWAFGVALLGLVAIGLVVSLIAAL